VSALGDKSEDVRGNACKALGKMGEKAATNEVISKLVSALGDESEYVRGNACSALGQMGEKAATNEVFTNLAYLINNDGSWVSYEAANAGGNILSSCAVIIQLDPNIITGFGLSINVSNCFKNVSEEEIIKFSFNTENLSWLPTVSYIALVKGVTIIAIEDKIVIYNSKEPIELSGPSGDISLKLIETFTDQRNRLHLYFDMA
jgi:HEAT repeats